jgi:hypothetical protein
LRRERPGNGTKPDYCYRGGPVEHAAETRCQSQRLTARAGPLDDRDLGAVAALETYCRQTTQ